jgi:hypothetical protein
MVDNFELIRKLLTFNSEDEFYFVQILQRKKDNPNSINGSNNSSRLIKAYYIDSLEKFDKQKEEMIFFANYFNARVGINLNKRSYYKTAFNTLKHIAEQMSCKNFKDVKRAYNTSCGIHNSIEDKVWLLDFDYIPISIDWEIGLRGDLSTYQPIGDKIIAFIPSKTGVHVITKPFDTRIFNKNFPDVEIHKNNPTSIYIP